VRSTGLVQFPIFVRGCFKSVVTLTQGDVALTIQSETSEVGLEAMATLRPPTTPACRSIDNMETEFQGIWIVGRLSRDCDSKLLRAPSDALDKVVRINPGFVSQFRFVRTLE